MWPLNKLEQSWYSEPSWNRLLTPLEGLFVRVAARRRKRFSSSASKSVLPTLVVGNISVGGTGKTPLAIELCRWFTARGISVAIVSRGYGGATREFPYPVTALSVASDVGDEPLLMALETGVPVVIDPDRTRAVDYIRQNTDCQMVISDDGLQHYAMPRDFEIAVVDGERGLGNGRCLPVGPLREPPSRLQEVDAIVVNGGDFAPNSPAPTFQMTLTPGALQRVNAGSGNTTAPKPGTQVHGVAGIGNPKRFFSSLRTLGFDVTEHAFDDHHCYKVEDLRFSEPVIMTSKDAVKCRGFEGDLWHLPVAAQLPVSFFEHLEEQFCPLIT